MKPKRPYLARALLDWIVDSGLTPYILVEVNDGVQVPTDYVQDGRIVFNISGNAVRNFNLDNDAITFSGRFAGEPFEVFVPMRALLAIYAKETNEGMLFEPESWDDNASNASLAESAKGKASTGKASIDGALSDAADESGDNSGDDDPGKKKGPQPGGPSLRVIK